MTNWKKLTFKSEMGTQVHVQIRLSREILTAFWFPPTCIALSCSHVQLVSSWVDLINVIWTPSPLCVAEQSIHRKTPYVTLAQVGFMAPQSKHIWIKRKCNDEKEILGNSWNGVNTKQSYASSLHKKTWSKIKKMKK